MTSCGLCACARGSRHLAHCRHGGQYTTNSYFVDSLAACVEFLVDGELLRPEPEPYSASSSTSLRRILSSAICGWPSLERGDLLPLPFASSPGPGRVESKEGSSCMRLPSSCMRLPRDPPFVYAPAKGSSVPRLASLSEKSSRRSDAAWTQSWCVGSAVVPERSTTTTSDSHLEEATR